MARLRVISIESFVTILKFNILSEKNNNNIGPKLYSILSSPILKIHIRIDIPTRKRYRALVI